LDGIALLLFFEDFEAGGLDAGPLAVEIFAVESLPVETLAAPAFAADLETCALAKWSLADDFDFDFETDVLTVDDLTEDVLTEDGLPAARVPLAEPRGGLLAVLRFAAAEPLVPLEETLVLRVFCDTACAWDRHAPVRCLFAEPFPAAKTACRVCRMC
jgi:hypothetical protein